MPRCNACVVESETAILRHILGCLTRDQMCELERFVDGVACPVPAHDFHDFQYVDSANTLLRRILQDLSCLCAGGLLEKTLRLARKMLACSEADLVQAMARSGNDISKVCNKSKSFTSSGLRMHVQFCPSVRTAAYRRYADLATLLLMMM